MSELVQKLLESIFRDNGIGFPASMDGPMMVDLSVFTQSGHIDIECADGTTFSLKPSLCLLCHELWRQYLKVKPVNGVTKVRLPYVE